MLCIDDTFLSEMTKKTANYLSTINDLKFKRSNEYYSIFFQNLTAKVFNSHSRNFYIDFLVTFFIFCEYSTEYDKIKIILLVYLF